MTPFYNSAGKRVCDLSEDRRVIEISIKDFLTRITVNSDGTLNIENIKPLVA